MKHLLKILLVVFCCVSFLTSIKAQSKIVIENKLQKIENELCLGKKRYTGWVATYHQNGKLKSCYQVKKGLIEGKMIEFWIFKQDSLRRFRDTIEINNLSVILEPENNEKTQISYNPIKRKEYLQNNFIKNGLGIAYDSLGNKFGEGNYKDNTQNGFWTYYNKGGKIMAKGEYVNGNETDLGNSGIPKNGRINLWSFYFENGNLKEESNYKEGKLNGPRKLYYENGNLKEESNYSDNKLQGLAIGYFNNGTKSFEENYVDGILNGLKKTYYQDGKLERELNYINDKLQGLSIRYFNNGNKSIEENYVDGILNGLKKTYYKDGKLEKEQNYINGKLQGLSMGYFNNGNKSFEEKYENDILLSNKTYYETGNLSKEENFNNGKPNGQHNVYFENGKIKEEKYYVDDKLNGVSKLYNENGNIKVISNFKNNKLNGIIKAFDENGKLSSETTVVNGTLHGPSIIYYPNGKIDTKGFMDSTSLQENKVYGDLYNYNEDGSLKSHFYFDKNGNSVDKSPIKTKIPTKTLISKTELNKSYQCKCCNAKIYGLTNGFTKGGDKCSMTGLESIFSSNELEKLTNEIVNIGYSNIYDYLRNFMYISCSVKCTRICY